jgi:hypothetical protein
MKAVAEAIRSAETSAWNRSNPETKARADSMTAQLEALIAGLKRKLAKVEASGDERSLAALKLDIEQREAMLDLVKRSAKGD